MDTTTTATSQVLLHSPELLTSILQHLPSNNLAQQRKICRQFRAVIDDTSLLQETLFLRPAPVEQLLRLPRTGHPRLIRDTSRRHKPGTYVITTLHPLLQWSSERADVKWADVEDGEIECDPKALNFKLDLNDVLKWTCKGSSRDMFVCQPPCTEMKVCFDVPVADAETGEFDPEEEYDVGEEYDVVVKRGDGVRVGDVVEGLRGVLLASRERRVECWGQDGAVDEVEYARVWVEHVRDSSACVRGAESGHRDSEVEAARDSESDSDSDGDGDQSWEDEDEDEDAEGDSDDDNEDDVALRSTDFEHSKDQEADEDYPEGPTGTMNSAVFCCVEGFIADTSPYVARAMGSAREHAGLTSWRKRDLDLSDFA